MPNKNSVEKPFVLALRYVESDTPVTNVSYKPIITAGPIAGIVTSRKRTIRRMLTSILLAWGLFSSFLARGIAASPVVGFGYQVSLPPHWTSLKVPGASHSYLTNFSLRTADVNGPSIQISVTKMTKGDNLKTVTQSFNRLEKTIDKGFNILSKGKALVSGVPGSSTTFRFYTNGLVPQFGFTQVRRVIVVRKGFVA